MKNIDRLNGKQKRAINEWNRTILFDFMYIDEINLGRMSFAKAWNSNIDWLNDWVNEATMGRIIYQNVIFEPTDGRLIRAAVAKDIEKIGGIYENH